MSKPWDFWGGPLNLDNITPLIHEGFIQDIYIGLRDPVWSNQHPIEHATSNGLCENSKFEKDEELPNNRTCILDIFDIPSGDLTQRTVRWPVFTHDFPAINLH